MGALIKNIMWLLTLQQVLLSSCVSPVLSSCIKIEFEHTVEGDALLDLPPGSGGDNSQRPHSVKPTPGYERRVLGFQTFSLTKSSHVATRQQSKRQSGSTEEVMGEKDQYC